MEKKRGPGRPRKEEQKPVKQLSDYPAVLLADEMAELFRMSRNDVYKKTREGKFKKIQGLGRTCKYPKHLLPPDMIPPEAFGGVAPESVGNSRPYPAGCAGGSFLSGAAR